MMVYDCFPFFNELELLEIRLNTLDKYVDKFVLVEADRTHSNKPKPFYFEDNKSRFAPFLDKIIHIKLSEYPDVTTSWAIENYQRNMVVRGLKNCVPEDIILVSDLDEIPSPSAIANYRSDGIKMCEQKIFICFLNYKSLINKHWYGTNIFCYRDLLDNEAEKHVYAYSNTLVKGLNVGSTPTKIRIIKSFPKIKNGGWHFTYMGGMEKIKYKLDSFAHQEYNNLDFNSDAIIDKRIRKGYDLIHPGDNRCIPVKIDDSFPEYIFDNQEKFSNLIYPVSFSVSLRNIYIILLTFLIYYVIRFPKKQLRILKKSVRKCLVK